MDDEELERRLREFDFSVFSPARENLLQKLLVMHRGKNHPGLWQSCRMDEDELDNVAAAGAPAPRETGDKPERRGS